jgi:hypothetical protein
VPFRNGCIPEAPEGGHSTQPGTLTDGAGVAPPGDPPEVASDEKADRALPAVLARPVLVSAVDVTAAVDPALEPPVVAAV